MNPHLQKALKAFFGPDEPVVTVITANVWRVVNRGKEYAAIISIMKRGSHCAIYSLEYGSFQPK